MTKLTKGLIATAAVVVVAAGGLGAYATRHHATTTSSSTSSTTTTTTAPIAPLTGLPDPGGAALTRPAMTVKIENDPNSLPQWGVDQADVVYEEIVNGGITRLAAIFNQNAPAQLGPVRSVRPTDTQVVWPLKGLFVFSGGAQYAINSISTAPVQLIDEDAAGAAMFRDPNRVAPYNLYGIGPKLFALATTHTPPPALFTYRSASAKVPGTRVASVTVPFPSIYPVTWTWDKATASWDRTLFAKLDVTGTGKRESPTNVVVMWINYVNGIGTMYSYGDLQGSGQAAVFTDGHEITGTWHRGANKSDIITYVDAKGRTIALTPGQTWVELLNDGTTLTVTK